MPGNKEKLALRAAEALGLKLEGHTYKKIGELLGVSDMTARRDVAFARIVSEDDAITRLGVQELMAQQYANAEQAGEIETRYLGEVEVKPDVESKDVNEVNKIKTSSQKMYSFLGGENARKDGTDKAMVSPEEMEKAKQSIAAYLADKSGE